MRDLCLLAWPGDSSPAVFSSLCMLTCERHLLIYPTYQRGESDGERDVDKGKAAGGGDYTSCLQWDESCCVHAGKDSFLLIGETLSP